MKPFFGKSDNKKIEKPRKINILLNFFLLALFFCGGFYVGIKIREIRSEQYSNVSLNELVKQQELKDSKDMTLFYEVWNKVDSQYVEKDLDEEEMIYGSIRGFIDSLGDYYSAFYDPDETEKVGEKNAGIFQGIGVTLRYNGDYTEIESPIDGFPAQKAGLLPGDIILKVGEEDMTKKRPYFVAEQIKGKAGTNVLLTIFREADEKIYEIEVTRGIIDIDNIVYEDLGDGIYQIKLYKFTEGSLAEFEQSWDEIVKEIDKQEPKGIILDLRNNPGGFVEGAVHVLEEFLPYDTKVMIEKNREDAEIERFTRRKGRFSGIPMVVLMNRGSASASEIVAGALQDHNRAKIIGQDSVGKGVEQKVIMLSDGSSLHLVFKRWFTPEGRAISFEEPIKPDIKVEYTTEDFNAKRDPQMDKAIEVVKEEKGAN
ncbi:PDZ domain-containing protein [Candidatus Dojkabacteria bacterium]|nr:PDZ domain-containing protein [Candidatus Dojkabacteria bacterium]